MRKVVKFGGSSLADAEQIRKAAAIIREDESRIYVVPSAPGKRSSSDTKVTDMLLKAYGMAVNGEDITEQLEKIKARYDGIIEGLGLQGFSLEGDFAILADNLKNEPQKDYTASRGEYLNGKVLAAYLGFEFIDAAQVIFFNDEGNLNSYKTLKTMNKVVGQKKGVVIPGFYGMGKDGRVRTFSRGGSDITGSIVAQAMKADMYENWTDVSGFLVADPRVIRDPAGIRYITYRELRELSYMGASVLHEDAVFPVCRSGIPIHICNTNRPQDEGTWIVESTGQKPDYVITGIAGRKGFCTVLITKSMMNSEIGFGRKVLQVLEEEGLSFEHMPSGIDTMTIVLHEDEFLPKEQQVISAIHRAVEPDAVEVEAGLSLVAVVGRGMRSAKGTAGRLFTALAKADINVRMIDQGSSELNIIIGVENKDFEKTIEAIYGEFITPASK
ncbi:MAG: aspartate kinase [Lachnospiraceae bacterium]|nr:aspartate kinase [Lachnospiraceae bacterium]